MVSDDALRDVLERWRKSLIGVTRGSSLVKFRTEGRQALSFETPGPEELLRLLRNGTRFAVRSVDALPPTEPEQLGEDDEDGLGHLETDRRPATYEFDLPEDCELLLATATADRIPGILRKLRKTAEDHYLDKGVNILYLAFGLLHWEDLDGTELCSPLLLVPVALHASSTSAEPTLAQGDDDSSLNPALRLLLEERGADLAGLPSPEDTTVDELLKSFRALLRRVGGLGEWWIDESVHLGKFTFTKEAMYRDLLENEERVIAHPIVRALSTTDPTRQTDEFIFDPLDPSEVDEFAPADDTPLVLDADSSQRAAIAAARAGKSFVMDGPPGTGKSQTIANMIAALIHDGRTVLFVSEKAAALDVVRNRLEKVNLGSFLFDIHSAKSSRRAVAEELAETLENKQIPPKDFDDVSRRTLADRQTSLSEYATASNEVRTPLNKTFHNVVGRLAQLADTPHAPAPSQRMADLSEMQLSTLLDAARKLSRAWRPAVEGSAFIWRGVATDRPLYRELDEARRHLERAETAAAPHRSLLTMLGWLTPEDYGKLPAALAHRDLVPHRDMMRKWLTAPSLEKHRASLETMVDEIRRRDETASILHSLTGQDVQAFPPPEQAPPAPSRSDDLRVGALDERSLRDWAKDLSSRARTLNDARTALHAAAEDLGVEPPADFDDAVMLHEIASLRERGPCPDFRWFAPGRAEHIRRITSELEAQHRYVIEIAARAQRWFTPAVLQLPVRELHQRSVTAHQEFGARFTAQYKADKRMVQPTLREGVTFKSASAHLDAVIEWVDADRYMQHLASTLSGELGALWRGPQTDYRLIWSALETVDRAYELLKGGVPPTLARYLSGNGDHRRTRALLDSAGNALGHWRAWCASLPALGPGPQAAEQPFDDSVEWLESFSDDLQQFASRVRWVSEISGRSHTVNDVETILPALAEARHSAQAVEANGPSNLELFGPLISDPDAVRAGLGHAQAIRDLVGGALDHETAAQLLDAGTVADLEQATDKWLAERERLLAFFNEERRDELRTELATLNDGVEMITAWRDDATGQQEWTDHRHHRDALVSHGLGDVVDFCARQKVAPEQIERVVEKAVLETWSEEILESDARLRPLPSADRDALVHEFRELDRRLIHHAAGQIIRAANARRPSPAGIGETGLIQREGARKRKHMPSRELIARARGAVQSLKPVFMMSPLAVSQYVSSDIVFDVVIFDEASQVLPADAINSIYRGRSLILAGDDKQLPPTTFFERSIEEEDDEEAEAKGIEGVRDYQSILELAKGSGAFPDMSLRWHYRSQHESLIAFSNYKFYDGKLITFPSALQEAEGIGVSFHRVQGMYQRGGSASNPAEAQAVARRVIRHYVKNPELSLGVVTFSVAQRDAIDAALMAELQRHPELEHHFEGTDRLGGFFIRSLESVQGDERDVIFFSVGYGPDEANKISTSFGVLNRAGGWRRLNVGITRARRAVEIFASMDPEQIPPSTNENVEHLRAYLQFARDGMRTLSLPFSPTGLDPESPFEDSVISTIRSWGYDVEPQVGAAGYRVDIGVRHPERPGQFVLGVECDGYQYHSAPAARDRDRLRDSILTGLGWTMHRIWGTAWYRHRAQEESRLRMAIDAAVSGEPTAVEHEAEALVPLEFATEVVPPDELPTWMRPYVAAEPIPLPWGAEAGDPQSAPLVRSALSALVEAEGPVHVDVMKERLRQWWRIGRIGARIQANIDDAIRRSSIELRGDFLFLGDSTAECVRAPSVDAARSVNQVSSDELALAVTKLVHEAGFATHDEVIIQLRKFFGWGRKGDQIASSLTDAIRSALADGWIEERDEMLVPVQGSGT